MRDKKPHSESVRNFDFVKFSRELARTLIKDSELIIGNWQNNSFASLQNFCSALQNFQQQCRSIDGQKPPECDPLAIFLHFSQLLENYQTPPQMMQQPEQFRKAWESANRMISELPEISRETIDPQIYHFSNDDNFPQKFTKLKTGSWVFLRKENNKITHFERKLRKQKPTEENWQQRPVHLKRFVRTFILLPLQNEILLLWNDYNHLLSRQIHSLQQPFVRITHSGEEQSQSDELNLTEIQDRFILEIEEWTKSARERIKKMIEEKIGLAQENCRLAATPRLPAQKFSVSRLNKTIRNYGRAFLRYRRAWDNHWNGEIKDWQKQIELSHICWLAQLKKDDIFLDVSKRMEAKVLQRLQFISAEFVAYRQKFLQSTFTGKNKLLQAIAANRKEIARSLLDDYIPDTIDRLLELEVGNEVIAFKHSVKNELQNLSDEFIIFKFQDNDKLIPESVLETIPLKELLLSRLDPMYRRLDEVRTRINDGLLQISDELSTLIEIIIYMGETTQEIGENTAGEQLAEISKKVLSTYDEGYQRAIDVTANIVSKLQEIQNTFLAAMNEFLADFSEITAELRENEKLISLKLELVGSRTRRKIRQWFKEVSIRFRWVEKAITRRILRRMSKASDTFHVSYRRLSEITRLRTVDQENSRAIGEYLKRTRDHLNKLPVIYSRLFRFLPLENLKLYISRQNEQEKLEDAYQNWRRGSTGLVAIVGEKGSGRTTFIKQNQNGLFTKSALRNIPVKKDIYSLQDLFEFLKVNFEQPQAKSIEDIEQIINEAETRTICIMENLHYVFLKTIEGLEIVKRLVLFMMRTDKNIFWIISSSYYTWNFLDKVVGISALFGTTIELEDFKSDELMNLIMTRHKLSGLPILFEAGENLNNSVKFRKIKDEMARQNWLKNKYFSMLEQVSDGNISVAMLYWLNSINFIENKRLVVSTREPVDLRFLQNLSTDDLFAIVVLIQHETITIEEFSRVLNLTSDEARLILTSLCNRGIVIEKSGRFELHFFLYRPLTRILYEKRLLH